MRNICFVAPSDEIESLMMLFARVVIGERKITFGLDHIMIDDVLRLDVINSFEFDYNDIGRHYDTVYIFLENYGDVLDCFTLHTQDIISSSCRDVRYTDIWSDVFDQEINLIGM